MAPTTPVMTPSATPSMISPPFDMILAILLRATVLAIPRQGRFHACLPPGSRRSEEAHHERDICHADIGGATRPGHPEPPARSWPPGEGLAAANTPRGRRPPRGRAGASEAPGAGGGGGA